MGGLLPLFVVVVLVIFVISIIANTIRHRAHTPAKEIAHRRAQAKAIERQSAELAFETQRRSLALKIKNLQAEDRIAALNGQPARNRSAIDALEGILRADAAYKSSQYAIAKQLELMDRDAPENNLHGPLETLVDAYVARRQANFESNDYAKAADQALETARTRALDAIKAAQSNVAIPPDPHKKTADLRSNRRG